ncbi:MAG: ribbon-helix-helix protein, CopG family [Elusimicrobiota bacterium]
MRTTKVLSFSLAPDLAAEFERMARVRRQDKSGLFREMIESYKQAEVWRRFQELQHYGARKAREAGVYTEEDIDRIVLRDRRKKK